MRFLVLEDWRSGRRLRGPESKPGRWRIASWHRLSYTEEWKVGRQPPNASRLSCSALVKNQIPLRALSASSAC